MEKYSGVISACPLFADIEGASLENLLHCLLAKQKKYEKNSFVAMADETFASIGIVLYGGVHIIREDFWGNRSIIARIEPGGLFGEAFSCAQTEKMPVSVLSVTDTGILFIDYRKIITTCSSACAFHTRLIRNMLYILAQKNIMLTQKLEFVTQRTTRDKLLSYLSAQALKGKSNSFEIPFDRQELAEFLSVDRSAMSNELSKMRKDGILRYNRNWFEIL